MAAEHIVTWMRNGASMYEALITAACMKDLADLLARLKVFHQPQSGAGDDTFQAVIRAFDALGVQMDPNGGEGFGDDLWRSLPFFGLRSLSDTSFVVVDPGTIPFGTAAFDDTHIYASRSVVPTWPKEHLYGAPRQEIWRGLFETFNVPIDPVLNPSVHDSGWRHWPHLDGRLVAGENAKAFGDMFAETAKHLLKDDIDILATQDVRAKLRQAVLPLVFAQQGHSAQGFGNPEQDFKHVFPASRLAYFYTAAPDEAVDHLEASVSPNPIKKVLKLYEPAKRLIYQGKGRDLRTRFYEPDGQDPRRLARRLKRHTNWWVR